MSALRERIAGLDRGVYDRIRAREAHEAARAEPTAAGFDALRGSKYCLLVSFRRSGEPVPTPVWFGLDAQGAMYIQTEAQAGKVKRVRADPRVRVAPSTARGKPTGPLAAGRARVLPAQDAERAERALRANYGLGRRLYERIFSAPLTSVYLEVTPEPAAGAGAVEGGAP